MNNSRSLYNYIQKANKQNIRKHISLFKRQTNLPFGVIVTP